VTEPVAPRLTPLARDDFDDAVIAALHQAFPADTVDRFLATGPDALALPDAITTMLHHPELAGRWLAFNNVLLWSPALDNRWRELIVLRVAWRTRSNYEWLQHVQLAQRFGVSPEEIDAVTRGADDAAWTPLESTLLAATDQLIDDYRINTETWTRLAETLDARQLVEVVFVVGAYTCLAMAFKSFGLQLDPGAQPTTIAVPDPSE
jgi:4-carboxymuconolactone decarboxylase